MLTTTNSLLAKTLGLGPNETVLKRLRTQFKADYEQFIRKIATQRNIFRPIKDIELTEEEIKMLLETLSQNPDRVIGQIVDGVPEGLKSRREGLPPLNI